MPQSAEHLRRSVTPYLVVQDAARALDFIETVLGGERVREPDVGDDGRVLHIEARIGDSLVMIGEADDATTPNRSTLYVEVDDTDTTHAHALEWGAKSVRAPRDESYGERTAGADDENGTTWWFATPIRSRQTARV